MGRISIDGVGVHYELLGDAGAPAVALTPGGRFTTDTPGLRELGQKLAEGGKRVLLWDRPNCGLSDICLDENRPESILHADTLAGLIRELDLGPTALCGGSAGARVSMIAAARHGASVTHLAIWWISGGPIGLIQLAMIYCGEAAHAANLGGMEAVANTFSWKETMEKNPEAKAKLLAMDPKGFIKLMQSWASVYVPRADTPVPGMEPADFASLKMPVLVFRSGESDLSHTRETSEWVHRLIPGSELREPPWPDDEWNRRGVDWKSGAAGGLFVNWPALAPDILKFIAK